MSSITQMRYRAPGPHGHLVEVLTFDRLRALNDGRTQRADFHVVAFVDGGRGTVTVDFASSPVYPGSVVWIAAGAVHRWDDIAEVTGHVVLFVPTAPVTEATRAFAAGTAVPVVWRPPDAARPVIDIARAHLFAVTLRALPDQPLEVPAILLSALLSHLQPPLAGSSTMDPLFAAFQAAVDVDFREHHDAEYYAQVLGYAPRTLSRAVQRATGRTAKGYVGERLALEAKRLLAHDGLTAADCAATLGFTDPSNFSAFFSRVVGMPPGAWQRFAARS